MSYEPTKKNYIVRQLRMIWLKSRERNAALKRDGYTCVECHRKQTMAKGKEFRVQVHHKNGITNWNKIAEEIMKELLPNPKHLETLCNECHIKKEIKNKRNKCLTSASEPLQQPLSEPIDSQPTQ